jgi:hypothetical protein
MLHFRGCQPLNLYPVPFSNPSVQHPTSVHHQLRLLIDPTRHTITQSSQEEANSVRPIPEPLRHWALAIIDPDTSVAMEYCHLMKGPHKQAWQHSFANEFGRLAQGVGNRIKGTNTIFFIRPYQIPEDRQGDVTYARICVNYRPQKEEKERTRLTVGGNKINYPGEVSTPMSDTTTFKILVNSVISKPNAKCMMGDISNFYLGTPMDRFEYMKIPIGLIPQEIIDQYKLMDLVHNGYIYMEIC